MPLYFVKKNGWPCEYPMKPMERHQPNSASFSIAGGGWGPRASVDHHVYTLTTRPVYIYTHTHTYVRFVCVCVCASSVSVCPVSRVYLPFCRGAFAAILSRSRPTFQPNRSLLFLGLFLKKVVLLRLMRASIFF